jgi:hypothetical protein
MRQHDPEVLVVGAGLLGRLVAYLAAKRGFASVHVYQLPDRYAHNLTADTLRGNGWVSSGLFWDRPADKAKACAEISASVRGLYDTVGLPFQASGNKALMRIEAERSGEFLNRAAERRLGDQVKPISDQAARNILGHFFRPGFSHFFGPDCGIDLSRVLAMLSIRLRWQDVTLGTAPVEVNPDPNAESGYRVRVAGVEQQPRFTVLCSGAALPWHLTGLDINHPLCVVENGLIRMQNTAGMQAPLLIDTSALGSTAGLLISRHNVGSDEILVAGSYLHFRVRDEHLQKRVVGESEYRAIRDMLPTAVRDQVNPPATCAWRTALCDEAGSAGGWWVQDWKRFPGLLAGAPAHVGWVYSVAREIVKRMGTPRGRRGSAPAVQPQWPCHMHFDSRLDANLDERESPDGAGAAAAC